MPCLVVEVGYSQSDDDLQRLAHRYLSGSHHAIKCVVALDIVYPFERCRERAAGELASFSVWRAAGECTSPYLSADDLLPANAITPEVDKHQPACRVKIRHDKLTAMLRHQRKALEDATRRGIIRKVESPAAPGIQKEARRTSRGAGGRTKPAMQQTPRGKGLVAHTRRSPRLKMSSRL